MADEWERELKRLRRELKTEVRAADPVTLALQTVLALAGMALVALTLAGVWGAWHQTTTKQTIAATTTTTVITTAAWSNALVASLLGTGLLLIFAGAFFNRITGLTFPGGLGITIAAAGAKVAKSLADRAPTIPSLRDPVTFRAVYTEALGNYLDFSAVGTYLRPPPRRSFDAGEEAKRQAGAGMHILSEYTRFSNPPGTLADIAVDKALSDLDLEKPN